MINPRHAIFPALLTGSTALIFLTSLIASPERIISAATQPQEPVGISSADCSIGVSFPESIQQWCPLIMTAAAEHQVEPQLLAAMMLQESGGDPQAYSSSGAVGLMQVMPSDGIAVSFYCGDHPCFQNRPTMDQLFDPDFNLDYSAAMMAGLIARTGDTREALTAYGPMDVGYYYADLVLTIYANYQ
jgi:hypothetical protein